jgi:hypothetical protein
MKKILIIISTLLFCNSAFSQTKHIHSWLAGTSAGWSTAITLTNVCNHKDIDVVVTFWDSAGSLLINQPISSSHITDVNGEVTVNLSSRQSTILSMTASHMGSYVNGSASVTRQYTKHNIRCLVGGYHMGTNKSGATNPYGYGLSYQLNGGNAF